MRTKKRLVTVFLLVGAGCAGIVFHHRRELAAWYRFARIFESLGPNEQGLSEFRHRESDIVFVRIPAGSFRMGSPEDEPGSTASERPLHEVRLRAFLIAKYELRRRDWTRFMGENPPARAGDAEWPVENVSWHDCQELCRRLGLSLPTEAQWERACRGGTEGPFSFGTEVDDRLVHCWYSGSLVTTVRVGSLPPNPFGLHEVHGNVAEWCEDVYDEDFYSRPETLASDPVCTEGTGHRVVRGGDAGMPADECRSASRSWHEPSNRSSLIGLRPVWNYDD